MVSLPDIFITKKAWEQIYEALRYDLKHEVQFFGRGAYLDQLPEGEAPRGNYVLYEIIIPPQEVTGAFTDTGEGKANVDSLNFIIMEAMRLGLPISGWNFWGHTHPSMSTRPSSQDHENMLMWAEQWGRAIGAVFNEKNEITGWGAGPHPLFRGTTCEIDTNLTIMYERQRDEAIYAQVSKWMKDNVKLEKPKPYVSKYPQYADKGNPPSRFPTGPAKGNLEREEMVQWATDVNGAINSEEEPDDVVLSSVDWNRLTDLYEEAEVAAAWAKYEDGGWVALTPWERGAVLLELDVALAAKPPIPIGAMSDEDVQAYFNEE